jgi:N-formylglutamate amidohydrolase
MNLFDLHRGNTPLVVDVPHAGTYLPEDIAARLTPVGRTVPDTDWHVDKLYSFIRDSGATLMMATHSRIVVDLNRDPTGAALYPGADNTELCPTRTFDNEAIYTDDVAPDADEIALRRTRYFDPYHAALAEEIARVRRQHGYAILLDAHSIRSVVPRFFAGRLPDLNLGTADGRSCAAALQIAAASVLASAGAFTSIVNGRFKGGYVTRHYGAPQQHVHALQLEKAQTCYMDEAPPYGFDPSRATPLAAVLKRLVTALIEVPAAKLIGDIR